MKVRVLSVSTLMSWALLCFATAHADWSQYEAVTAENWDSMNPPLNFEKPVYDAESNTMEFVYPAGWKSVWLISSSEPLSAQDQNMRTRRWCGFTDLDGEMINQTDYCNSLEPIAAELVRFPLDIVEEEEAMGAIRSRVKRTSTFDISMEGDDYRYLYIDFAFPVNDGGYYLSLDLNSFVPE